MTFPKGKCILGRMHLSQICIHAGERTTNEYIVLKSALMFVNVYITQHYTFTYITAHFTSFESLHTQLLANAFQHWEVYSLGKSTHEFITNKHTYW